MQSEEKARSIELGRKLLEKEARRFDVNPKTVLDPAALAQDRRRVWRAEGRRLLAAIGYGKVAARNVLTKLVPQEQLNEKPPEAPSPPWCAACSARARERSRSAASTI